MKKLTLMLALALAGCVSPSPYQTSRVDYNPSMKAYIDCNFRHSLRLSRTSNDAMTAAIAAESMCSREAADMSEALAQNFGPVRAREMADRYERQTIKTNVGTIVRARG